MKSVLYVASTLKHVYFSWFRSQKYSSFVDSSLNNKDLCCLSYRQRFSEGHVEYCNLMAISKVAAIRLG